jgi:lysophospholipase L1-like esterase
MMRPRRRWPWILLFLLICVGGLGAAEWWARGINPQTPTWQGPDEEQPGLMTGQATRLWGMTPGERVNGRTTASINKYGIRGSEPELPRPEGRQRILTLGDSSFFGFLVSDEDVFSAQLQTYLRKRGVDVDVVNAGVAGYSIAQHKVFMDEIGWDLQPTLIVYCNLWSDNTWDTFRDEDLLASRRFAQYNPLVHSAAFRLLAGKLAKSDKGLNGKVIMWSENEGWPEGKVRRVPLPRFMQIHDEMIRKAAGEGIGGAFLIPTNSSLMEESSAPPGISAWDPYFKAYRMLGEHHEMPVINISEVFGEGLAEGLDVEDLILDKMHPSPEGHQRMAEALGAALLASGWPDNALAGSTEPVDASTLRDIPGIRWTDDSGAGSPQRLLFEISETEQAAIKERAEARAAEGPVAEGLVPESEGPVDGPTPGEGGFDLTPPPSDNWRAEISVSGGKAPYKVTIRDPDGKPVSSARLLKPMSIRLMVREGITDAVVEIKDGEGTMVSAPITQSAPSTALNLGG